MWVSHSLTSTIVGGIICTYALFYFYSLWSEQVKQMHFWCFV